jgi:KUP system potassium uptake protein
MESLAKFIKLDVLYRCSDGSAPWDSSHYERENVQTVIGTSGATVPPRLRRLPRRRASAATTRRSELSSTALAERKKQVRFAVEAPAEPRHGWALEELHELCEAQESGTAFILGHSHVKTKPGSWRGLPKS